MKNIHILPTDKPSRIWVNNLRKKYELETEPLIGSNTTMHIYITDDEVTLSNNGDYYLGYPDYNTVHKWCMEGMHEGKQVWINKIILTTDLDLIKDGIQAIDDEFLEWFVKNPSFDRVDVERIGYDCIGECGICDYSCRRNYKIIIPQEEAKQENKKVCTCKRAYVNILSGICSLCWNEKFPDEKEEINEDDLLEPKQETLEEAAERLFPSYPSVPVDSLNRLELIHYLNNAKKKEGFTEGAKYQDERMYSEENLRKAFKAGIKVGEDNACLAEIDLSPSFEEWFEQFKKK